MTYASDQKMHVLDMPARTRRIFSMRDAVLTQWEHEVRAKVRAGMSSTCIFWSEA